MILNGSDWKMGSQIGRFVGSSWWRVRHPYMTDQSLWLRSPRQERLKTGRHVLNWKAKQSKKGKTVKKIKGKTSFSDLVLYDKDELLGSQPLCLPHIDGFKAWSQSAKLDATIWMSQRKNWSHLGVEICFRRLGIRLKFDIKESKFISGENPFWLHLSRFHCCKVTLELAENSKLCHVCHQSTMDNCIFGLWTISNNKCPIISGKPTSPFFASSRHLESTSLHSGRLSMKVAGRLVAAVEEKLLWPVCRQKLWKKLLAFSKYRTWTWGQEQDVMTKGWLPWTSWLPFEMTLFDQFQVHRTQIKWQFPASAFEWPWIVKIGTCKGQAGSNEKKTCNAWWISNL